MHSALSAGDDRRFQQVAEQATDPEHGEAVLCALLPRVSRSFAVSIEAMPDPLRGDTRIAYLLCRLLDTIEDDRSVEPALRADLFDRFQARLAREAAQPLGADLTADGADGALWRRAELVFSAFQALPGQARQPIAACLAEMGRGMRGYAARADAPGGLFLRDAEELDRYCYFVAGTVGVMLTELFELRGCRPAATAEPLREQAIRFGAGLQMVNILKDVAEDAAEGRCYLPATLLAAHGVPRAALLDPRQREQAMGVVHAVASIARAHLAQAVAYTLRWPGPEGRPARLFCGVPLALAFATLNELEAGQDALREGRAPKIPRERAAELLSAVVDAVDDERALAQLFEKLAARPARPRGLSAAPTRDEVERAIARGTQAILRTQRADGAWQGTNDAGPLFTGAALAMEQAVGVLRADDAAQGVRLLRAAQLPDGSVEAWPHSGRPGHEATCFWYAGMRAAGVAEDDPAMVRARSAIEAGGGFGNNLLIVRAFLAAAGVLEPKALPWVPLAHTLVPGYEAFFGKLFGVNALVPLHTLPPLIRGLRDRGSRKSALRALAERRIVAYLSERQDPSGSLAGVPLYTMFMAMVLRLCGVPAEDERIARAVAFHRRAFVRRERGLFVQPFTCENWDTAHCLRVLAHLPHGSAALRRGLDYMLAAQSLSPAPEDWQMPRPGAPRIGGWSWQAGNARNPDIDSTAFVLSALAPYAVEDRPELVRSVRLGAEWLLSMQNQDGGFAAFSHGKRPPPEGALYLGEQDPALRKLGRLGGARHRVERWLAENGDPSTADVTGRVLHGLGSLGHRRGEAPIDAAIAFLRRHQLDSGAFWGRWSVNTLPATSYIVTGLRAAGVPAGDPIIWRAAGFLRSCQNADGGFGETPDSHGDPALAGLGPSSAQVTGVVTWALCAAGFARSGVVARALRWLMSQQREDGGWDDRTCYGVIFPHRYYYVNDCFPTTLALEGLQAFLGAADGGGAP